MKHASSLQVFEYWNEVRGQRAAPERGEIEPGRIRHALGDTFILGQQGPDIFRFRLAGTRTCALFCRELKGAGFVGLWDPAERSRMLDLLRAANGEGSGFIAGVTGHTAGGASLQLELLLLPLRHRDRSQHRLLGVLAPAVTPYWLGTTAIESLALGGFRLLGQETRHIASPRLVPDAENGRVRRGFTVFDGGRS